MPNRPSSTLSGEVPLTAGSNSGLAGELFLLDHLAGEIARQHDLELAGHRFRIDGGDGAAGLVGFGAQEHVLAHLEQQARLRDGSAA